MNSGERRLAIVSDKSVAVNVWLIIFLVSVASIILVVVVVVVHVIN